jgi:hypothetical protein
MNQFDHSQSKTNMQTGVKTTLEETQTMTQQQVSQPAAHIVIGSIQEVLNNQIIITYERNLIPQKQAALATVSVSKSDVSRQVALMFTEQGQPIIMGFITAPVISSAASNSVVNQENTMTFDIVQDGEHCQIQASKSITLKCGESSISMNSQGEIAINGESIKSKARKKHHILGGSISLN